MSLSEEIAAENGALEIERLKLETYRHIRKIGSCWILFSWASSFEACFFRADFGKARYLTEFPQSPSLRSALGARCGYLQLPGSFSKGVFESTFWFWFLRVLILEAKDRRYIRLSDYPSARGRKGWPPRQVTRWGSTTFLSSWQSRKETYDR